MDYHTTTPARATIAVTPSDSTTYPAGSTLLASITVAGLVAVELVGGSQVSLSLGIGSHFLPLAVTKVLTTGTTATGTYHNIG